LVTRGAAVLDVDGAGLDFAGACVAVALELGLGLGEAEGDEDLPPGALVADAEPPAELPGLAVAAAAGNSEPIPRATANMRANDPIRLLPRVQPCTMATSSPLLHAGDSRVDQLRYPIITLLRH
jgi:hypothetical protein